MKWALILLAAAISSRAQNAAEIKALDPDHAYNLAARWIFDQDPRHRAWAAELIAGQKFAPLYPKLLTALNELQPLLPEKFGGTPNELALEAVADAIIQVNIQVPAVDSQKLYPGFPALSMILLSRPVDDNQAALLSILDRSKVGEVWLAAANLLAPNPPPGFVVKLLDDFQVVVRIMLLEAGRGGGISYGDCASSTNALRFKIPEDWPAFSVYSLQPARSAGNVVATGNNTVSFVARQTAADVGAPWVGSSDCGEGPIERSRQELIAQLAGIDSSTMGLKSPVDRGVVVENDQQYQREVIGVVQEQEIAFRHLLALLQAKGLLTQAEAIDRRLHMQLYIIPFGSHKTVSALPDLTPLGIVLLPHPNTTAAPN